MFLINIFRGQTVFETVQSGTDFTQKCFDNTAITLVASRSFSLTRNSLEYHLNSSEREINDILWTKLLYVTVYIQNSSAASLMFKEKKILQSYNLKKKFFWFMRFLMSSENRNSVGFVYTTIEDITRITIKEETYQRKPLCCCVVDRKDRVPSHPYRFSLRTSHPKIQKKIRNYNIFAYHTVYKSMQFFKTFFHTRSSSNVIWGRQDKWITLDMKSIATAKKGDLMSVTLFPGNVRHEERLETSYQEIDFSYAT